MQLKSDEIARLLNKPFVNEIILRGQNLSLKCCQSLKLFTYIERGVRSFHKGNIGPLSQRAAKLLSVTL